MVTLSHGSSPIGQILSCLTQLPHHRHLTPFDNHSFLQPIPSRGNIMHKEKLRTRLKQAGKDSKKCLKSVAWQTCKCVLYTICAPCLCCALLCLPRSRRRRCCVQEGRPIPRPRPQFPTPRPRALSLPLIEAQPYQQTASQPNSDLFTKLPLEIRRLIYAEALGGVAIHFRTEHGKPRAMKCVSPGECACSSFDPELEEPPSRGLALLRTCRIV